MAELTKEQRISKEEKRIRALYKDLPKDTLSLYDGLIRRAAYMRVTLEDYEEDIIENGSTEFFTQSVQTAPYERERPVSAIYNRLIKNYQVVMKQLKDALPEQSAADAGEELLRFAVGGK
jgi:hypothetical protein